MMTVFQRIVLGLTILGLTAAIFGQQFPDAPKVTKLDTALFGSGQV
jgi:hypothetical protein